MYSWTTKQIAVVSANHRPAFANVCVRLPLLHHLDEDGPGRNAEHRKGNGHERQVIPHRDAENARQEQFELQQGESGKEEPDVGGPCRPLT